MHILIVDDDADDQALISESLSRIDPSVTYETANNGEQALGILSTSIFPPDVIFLDLNMPAMDGLTCLRKIRGIAQLKDIKVVVLSTSICPKDELEIKMLSAEYKVKPDNFRTLTALLYQCLLQNVNKTVSVRREEETLISLTV